MNCSPSAWAAAAIANAQNVTLMFMFPPSMREGPESQLFFRDLPEPGETFRFDDEKEDDQSSKDHDCQIRGEAGGQCMAEESGKQPIEQDGQEHDERGAEEGAEDAGHPADDDHEEDAEGEVEAETLGLDRA